MGVASQAAELYRRRLLRGAQGRLLGRRRDMPARTRASTSLASVHHHYARSGGNGALGRSTSALVTDELVSREIGAGAACVVRRRAIFGARIDDLIALALWPWLCLGRSRSTISAGDNGNRVGFFIKCLGGIKILFAHGEGSRPSCRREWATNDACKS